MKGLSLTQPWATLVAVRAKQYETRSWRSQHIGRIAIHAAKGFPASAKEECMGSPFLDALITAGYSHTNELPRGAILAVCDVVHYESTDERPHEWLSEEEIAFGDYSPGRWAWKLENVLRLREPIPCKGALGLWEVPADVAERVEQSEVAP